MPKNSCIMQIWAEPEKSALPICKYQFLTFTIKKQMKRFEKKMFHSSSFLNITRAVKKLFFDAQRPGRPSEITDDAGFYQSCLSKTSKNTLAMQGTLDLNALS